MGHAISQIVSESRGPHGSSDGHVGHPKLRSNRPSERLGRIFYDRTDFDRRRQVTTETRQNRRESARLSVLMRTRIVSRGMFRLATHQRQRMRQHIEYRIQHLQRAGRRTSDIHYQGSAPGTCGCTRQPA